MPRLSSEFRNVLLVLLSVVLWSVVCFWRTTGEIVAIWLRSDTFQHGLVVLPVFFWLVWRRREAIGHLRITPSAWLILPVVLAAFMWLLGEIVSAAGVSHFALVLVLILSMAAVVGTRIARILLFPLLFLFYAAPVGEFLIPWLMKWTANVLVVALRGTGFAVYQEGQQLLVAKGDYHSTWQVVEACSGIRYLIASTMLGALFAWINFHSLKKRLIFFGVSILVPILAN